MMTLARTYSDVNEAYYELQYTKKHYVQPEKTRNGPALVYQEPVLITHASPYRRVLFDPVRNANPFFHYMESIWMLAGSNTVPFLAKFSSQIKEYSDNGYTFHGAYGHRWRNHFGVDQIDSVIHMLKKDPATRRALITMWDPASDLERLGKDLPCNTHVYLGIRSGVLHMTVCNRSNDMVWGMLGANIVHMSILQEYIANALEIEVGDLNQFTVNLHIYEDWVDKWNKEGGSSWYKTYPNVRAWRFGPRTFDIDEADRFIEDGIHSNRPYQCRILRDNAVPMYDAWETYKANDLPKAIHIAQRIYDDDWRHACVEWLQRVEDKRGQ
jgi:thymidylate synthase